MCNLTASRLLHVPPRHHLGYRDEAANVGAIGDRVHPLAEIEMRHEVPGVLLHLARDGLARLERRRLGPLVAELLVLLVRGPAEPALFAVGGVACEGDRAADRI